MTQSYRKLIYLIVFSQLINERISKRVQVSVGLFQMLNQVCTVHPLWSAGKREITISRLKENIVRWPLEPLLYNLKQSCVDRTSKTHNEIQSGEIYIRNEKFDLKSNCTRIPLNNDERLLYSKKDFYVGVKGGT